MKLFMLKSFLLASLMFVSVLFGMQQANDGIHRMKGYEDTGFGKAFTLNEDEQGKMAGTFLGNDVTSHDLEKKKQELAEMNSYNFFSSIGKSMAKGISEATEKTINYFVDKAGK
ncbi:YqxA family protein [Neobacillus sp. LXY-4]|uniref:YqxA family protein n=1 Tax=Neobacillus sp. LXY-4 TaxID=3379826 RepID=UPI003EE03CDA